MGQILHGSATTTEAIRRAIQHSQESLRVLAKRYSINQKTVAKWKKRGSVSDLPTGPRATDNGVQFTFPPRYADGPTATYMTHMFDTRCEGIEHRLTKVRHPWTNGRVERMNQTIKEATVRRYHYNRHEQLEHHLADFIDAYNYGRRLKTPKDLTPYEFIVKTWTKEPQRFKLNPTHQMPESNI